ncbi:HAD-IA family hydrolase [Lachnospiraceae bacterium OttesenSCG-928-D06]|nr:HAD-IA family hydrolase [Lachnospiraceae bacterium OttesenSCG-928-D06]
MKMKLYVFLVNRVPAIRRKYHELRERNKTKVGQAYAWLALLSMNIAWVFGKREFGKDPLYPDRGKKIPIDQSESTQSKRKTPKEFAQELLTYDVISFDIFDTLIFRPFSKPEDAFYFLDETFTYLDFKRIRSEMEFEVRQQIYQKKGHYEVTLEEIWDYIERNCGIDKKTGMEAEIKLELDICYGNPYILEVFEFLKENDKKIIAVSDMYLPADVIQQMVEKCGFEGISQYFVSCEYKMSKSEGSLYKKVMETCGKELRYIHIGDNPHSDVKKAEEASWNARYYANVNKIGKAYRVEDMSVITGSLYRGIVNTHIHNGLKVYSREYELGFIYGGIFVQGYCQFIHEYVRTHEIDKLLFFSRDGDILCKAYQMLYPDEENCQYVYWSRLAATKMGADRFRYDYFRRFLHHKVNQGYTLESIFTKMEIEDMLEGCLAELNGDTEKEKTQTKYHKETELTTQNEIVIRDYLLDHFTDVRKHYEDQIEAGKAYYQEILKGCKNVAAVDIGWAGSGAVVLDYLVNQVWNLNCQIIGLLAGTNSIHSVEPNMSEALISSGKLNSYLFSQEKNREIWKQHDAGMGYNIFFEVLLGSPTKSLKGFGKSGNGGYELIFNETDKEPIKKWVEVQKGILDFVEISKEWFKNRNISGADAYAAMGNAVNNSDFMKNIEKEYKIRVNLD